MKLKIITAVICIAMASCGKESTLDKHTQYSGETVPVEIMINNTPPATRAGFFDEVESVPAATERRLDIIRVYVFNEANQQVFYQEIGHSGPDNCTATLQLPRELCGTTCKFYVSGNADVTLNNAGTIYNAYYSPNMGFPHRADSYAQMIDPAYWKADKHFIMSGSQDVYIEPYGQKTYTRIELSRVEAKIALRVKVADDFSQTHRGATLTINDIRVKNLSGSVYLFRDSPFEEWNRTLLQEPMMEDGYYHNLYYIFPRGSYSNPVNIVISGIYDYDGDPATTEDQTPVEYDLPVSETGEVKGNHFYRIDCLIKGVGKKYLDLNFTVKPWVDIWQDIEVGN